ncbi:putative Ser/Thr protein kinase [Caldalkalibacillus uzonensis]|uniref:Ser/Thr protein kinase n=1 Tax=Caldalkalibacillus uzonensis TaxID=353224 RepID=A0ABU0CTL3_9BACI|nr:hypothetical protein [Caldalkalibacillus uzonensis]MDQ0339758.1 putative Ser/Thr protein kinase [Caldalkalibacillus uzonensis]
MSFLESLAKYQHRESQLRWEGTFAEYLDIVKADPSVAQHAHARIYQMICDAGVEHQGTHQKYKFFESELFGLEEAIQNLVEEYFKPAAERLDVRKRLLLLMGPVSGGKSTIVTLLKKGLEAYTRTDRGRVYAIQGCPMHEEPLHLIPHELRQAFMEEYQVRIEGDLCPVCQLRLEEEYNGDIMQFKVERIVFFRGQAERDRYICSV